MNINLKFEEIPDDLMDREYATHEVTIYIDERLAYRTKRTMVVHAIIENYCRNWPHNKVEELTECIQSGLDDLDEYQSHST